MQSLRLKGLMELAGHEAIVLAPYYDSVGVLTWGIGHTSAAGAPFPATLWGHPSTLLDALSVFREDLRKYEADVLRAFKRPLNQAQFDAAVSFHFNTGAISYATWVKKFNAGDIRGAGAAIMAWTRPAGIVERRHAEQVLFERGVYSGGEHATVYSTDGKGHVEWSTGKLVYLRPVFAGQQAAPAVLSTPLKRVAPAASAIKSLEPFLGDFPMKIFALAAATAAFAFMFATVAFADTTMTAAPAATAVAAVATTSVDVPIGSWLSDVQTFLTALTTALVAAGVAFGLPFLPATLRGVVSSFLTPQVEQLLVNAINYGINTVTGAEQGKNLEVNVGNAVVAQALQYVLDHGPGWLISWAGGADLLEQKIVARLNLVSGTPATAAAAPAAPATS